MSQLTKEYFDQQLGKLATKEDLKPLVTKAELENLKAHIDTEVHALREEMKQGFKSVDLKLEAIHELLDVRQRVETLERQVQDLLSKAA